MTPKLSGIDHVHVYVGNWAEADAWYEKVLGFKRVEALMGWAVENGPLTIEDPVGKIHLALFEREDSPTSTIAFGADGETFLQWKAHLEQHSLELRVADHQMAWSLYFHDPFGNMYEITTYDHEHVTSRLS